MLWRGAKVGSPRLQSWSELSNLGRRAETGVNYRNGKTKLSINFNRFLGGGDEDERRLGPFSLAPGVRVAAPILVSLSVAID